MNDPYVELEHVGEGGNWWSEAERAWLPLPPDDDFGPPPGGAALQIRADADGYPALAQLVLYAADVDGYLKAVGLNESDEELFPALAELVQYSNDADGYLRALGISEEAIAGEPPLRQTEGTTGRGT